MSCDWNVYCVTCDSEHRFSDANHQEDLMRTLVRHAKAIGALKELMSDGGWSIEFGTYYGPIDVVWFAEHSGHALTIRDEYGRKDNQCRDLVRCASCSSAHNCVLEAGHEPPCSPVRPVGS